jgi:hypothetical protein
MSTNKEISLFRHSQRDNAKKHELNSLSHELKVHISACLESYVQINKFDEKMLSLQKENQSRYQGYLSTSKDIEALKLGLEAVKRRLGRKIELEVVTQE